ncbi:NAD-dependent epimerase/dehydratase family protein [Pelagibacteraceae bacterium]|jgi:nucleoside-diphosphate-sugar epimerase|nr:NAD-dependent epimerase/dehydratase family protein [Pelagibacteraceae bacterium]MDC0952377.1 NAD-dependent epimerase/dehydratase family protein [Pelagibacteraceae bacterium]
METKNIICFGFGQVAKNFIKKLNDQGIPFQLTTTSREESKSKKFKNINYESFQFTEENFDENFISRFEEADHILLSIAPISGTDIVIKNLKDYFKSSKFKWITYLSTTSVYGDHSGGWVDEKSETKPTSPNGVERLKVEKEWMELAVKFDLPLQIFRLSGIYSNQFNILKRLKSGEAKIINKKNHFFSRIHVEDIANVLFSSLNNFKKKEIYNISDNLPASAEEVAMYGVKLLGMDKPKAIEINEIENEMLKNFYKDSKKVDNKKMKEFFSLKLKYPTYVEGLNYIFNNNI